MTYMTWVQDKNRSNSDVIDDLYKMVGYKTKIDQYFTFCTYESMTNHYVINNAENKPAPMAPPSPPCWRVARQVLHPRLDLGYL